MSDKNIKPTSLRLEEEDIAKFKGYAEEMGLNQAQAFNSLIGLLELERAKGNLVDRGKEIDTFRDTVNKLIGFYINSLEVNATTEETIREELKKELSIKDNVIQQLQEDRIKLIASMEEAKKEVEALDKEIERYKKEVEAKDKNIEAQEKQLKTMDMLQEQLKEYKSYKDNYKALEELYKKADEEARAKEGTNKELRLELNNIKDKCKDYKERIEAKDKDIEGYKEDIKGYREDIKRKEEEIKELKKKKLEPKINRSQIKEEV